MKGGAWRGGDQEGELALDRCGDTCRNFLRIARELNKKKAQEEPTFAEECDAWPVCLELGPSGGHLTWCGAVGAEHGIN